MARLRRGERERVVDVSEKLTLIEKSGMQVAYDGCHKLYLCENEKDVVSAQESGYDIHPASQIRDLINSSCGLVFVNNWALNGGSWTSEITIEQFELPESWYVSGGGVDL